MVSLTLVAARNSGDTWITQEILDEILSGGKREDSLCVMVDVMCAANELDRIVRDGSSILSLRAFLCTSVPASVVLLECSAGQSLEFRGKVFSGVGCQVFSQRRCGCSQYKTAPYLSTPEG